MKTLVSLGGIDRTQPRLPLGRSIGISALALLLAGCLPEGFIWWSPNGETAAVRTEEGLRLADPNGRLSAVILSGQIQSASWLPDGSSLVVSRSLKLTNWATVEALLPREEAEETRQLARAIPDLLKAGLTVAGGSLDELSRKFLEPLRLTENQLLEPAWFCALSLHRAELQAAFAGFTNSAQLEAEMLSAETNSLSLYEITVVPIREGRAAGDQRLLLRTLRPLQDAVASPRHPVVSFRTGNGALKAMSLDGKSAATVADADVAFAAWSADGCSLIYVVMRESGKLGEIHSRTVVTASGELLRDAPRADTLALAAFADSSSPRLAVLPDGRILFASVPIALPARAASVAPSARFFLLDPAQPDAAPAPVVLKEGSLPDDLSAFALSPDGRLVAVVESATDAIAVLELATGKVKIISPSHPERKSRMIPAWRNARELTFAALPSSTATRPELIFWQSEAPTRVLSADWPDRVVNQWLEAPKRDEQQPAR